MGDNMNISKNKPIILLVCLFVGLACSTESKATNVFTYTEDLYNAIQTGDVLMVESLLTQKRFFPHRLLFVNTYKLLCVAARYNQIAVAEMLLKIGANINCWLCDLISMQLGKNSDPLLIAVVNNHPEMVEFLIMHGASVNTYFYRANTIITVLDLAKEKNFYNIVDILLRNGANVN